MAARVDGRGSAFRVIDVRKLFDISTAGARASFGIWPDGQRFLFNTPARSDQPTAPPPPIAVVNWPAQRGK
jgi:hypothetical protein